MNIEQLFCDINWKDKKVEQFLEYLNKITTHAILLPSN